MVESHARSKPQTDTLSDLKCAARHDEKVRRLENEIEHLQKLAAAVKRESHEDPLTGLFNRRHFEIEMKSWVSDLRKGRPGFALFYIDLDRFKLVKDSLGHQAGDLLLVSVSDVLSRLTSDADLVARIGGDEFIILKPLGDSALQISALADRITSEVKQTFAFDGRSAPVSVSIGVAIADLKSSQPDQVITDADMALYHAKSAGRGRWSFFTEEMPADLILTKQLEADILRACDRREFVVFLQPLIEAKSGRVTSAEALVRWIHPTKGLLSPDIFLKVADRIGCLRTID